MNGYIISPESSGKNHRDKDKQKCVKEQRPEFRRDLLNKDRKIVGLLTRHCRLNRHMYNIGLADDATCRYCQEEEETPVHVLCQYEGLARTRFLIDEYVLKRRVKKRRFFPVWFTTDIKRDIRRKHHFLKIFRRFNNHYYRYRVQLLRASIKARVRTAYLNYIRDMEINIKTDPKRFWSFVNTKKGCTRIPGNMLYNNAMLSEPIEIVNGFADYFSSVYILQFINIDNTVDTALNKNVFRMKSITDLEIQQAVAKLKGNLTIGPDGLPSFLVKDCTPCLLIPLKIIYNGILAQRSWRKTTIVPVFKSGSRNMVNNYR